MRLALFFLSSLGLAAALNSQGGGDWPQWGKNATRNMVSSVKGLPDEFSVGKYIKGTENIDMATTKNIKWVADLGSQSYGNPVISGGKVFVGTNNESLRDPKVEGDKGNIMCFRESDGKFLWPGFGSRVVSRKAKEA